MQSKVKLTSQMCLKVTRVFVYTFREAKAWIKKISLYILIVLLFKICEFIYWILKSYLPWKEGSDVSLSCISCDSVDTAYKSLYQICWVRIHYIRLDLFLCPGWLFLKIWKLTLVIYFTWIVGCLSYGMQSLYVKLEIPQTRYCYIPSKWSLEKVVLKCTTKAWK